MLFQWFHIWWKIVRGVGVDASLFRTIVRFWRVERCRRERRSNLVLWIVMELSRCRREPKRGSDAERKAFSAMKCG